MPISCHFRDCKALLVTTLTHVNGALASVQTFTFSLKQKISDVVRKLHHIVTRAVSTMTELLVINVRHRTNAT